MSDDLVSVLVILGGLMFAVQRTKATAGGGPKAPAMPGAPVGTAPAPRTGPSGAFGGDAYWTPDQVYGPDPVAFWLTLQDDSGQPVYARGATVYTSYQTVVPVGTILTQKTGLLGLDKTHWRHNGDQSFTATSDGTSYPITDFLWGPMR